MTFQIKQSYYNDGDYLQITKKDVTFNVTFNTLEKIHLNKIAIDESLMKPPSYMELKLTSDLTLSAKSVQKEFLGGGGGFGFVHTEPKPEAKKGYSLSFVTLSKGKESIILDGKEWNELKQISMKQPSVSGTFPYEWNYKGIKVRTAVAWINHLGVRVSPWECNMTEFYYNSSDYNKPGKPGSTIKQVNLYIPPADKLLRMCYTFLTDNQMNLAEEERSQPISNDRLLHMYVFMRMKLHIEVQPPSLQFDPVKFCQTKPHVKENHNDILNEMMTEYL